MAASPARAAMGFPPKVAACIPGRRLAAISALASIAAPGSPPQIDFARVMMSGVAPTPW